jgi:hypothetical protein
MAITGDLWIHPTTLVCAEFVVHMDRRQRVVVVRGSGGILNSVHKESMEYSQRL